MNKDTEPLDQPILLSESKRRNYIIIVLIIGFTVMLGAILFLFLKKESLGQPPQEVDEKPIIYLYPEENTTVNVQLAYQGELTTTYPKYNPEKGWTVEAQPDGTLLDAQTGKEYYGLYWEGKDSYQYDLSKGFVVKGKEAANFLDEKLAKLGLNRREANEFIIYWLPILEENEYNFIHFAQEEYTQRAVLHISPKPTTFIRLLMCFKALDYPINIEEQILNNTERKGFTVVEWGGRKLNEDILK